MTKNVMGLAEIKAFKDQLTAVMPIEQKLMCPHLWAGPKKRTSSTKCYGVELCLACARQVKKDLEAIGESLLPGDHVE